MQELVARYTKGHEIMKRRDFIQGFGLFVTGAIVPAASWAGSKPAYRPSQALAGTAPHVGLDNGPTGALAPPPKNFSSNHNYYMYGGGQPIRELVVTVDITTDLVVPTGGLNMQLNGYSPADANCVYQQYCMAISPKHQARLGWSNENFPSKAYRWQLHNKLGRSCKVAHPTEATCKGDIFNMNTGSVSTFSGLTNRFPAGSRLIWELLETADGAISGATYSFVDPTGHKSSTGPQLIKSFKLDDAGVHVGSEALAPLLAFQLNIVGLNGGAHTTLSSGAGRITYQAKTALTAKGKQPADTAAQGVSTQESSNIAYAKLSTGSKSKFVQDFSVS